MVQTTTHTNPASGFVYNPTYPTNSAVWPYVNDQGWFYNDTGATYHCGNTLCRDITSNVNISPDVLRAIVGDSVITSDYITESQTINQNAAYEAFMRDSALWMSSQEYIDFVAAQRTQATGRLYDVKEEFVRIYAYDNSFVMQVRAIDSMISDIAMRINEYDSLALVNNSYINFAMRNDYLNQLQIQFENRLNLFYSHNANRNSVLIGIAQQLLATVTSEIPQANEKMLYDLELDLIENGNEVIENYLSTLFYVASQCPYSGGNAVYKARAYLETIYDTLYWDDANGCFNEGIYKQSNNNSQIQSNNIYLQPNPTTGLLEIIKTSAMQGNCLLEIRNSLSEIVFRLNIVCKQGLQFIDLSKFVNGVYTVTIKSEDKIQLVQKIVKM